MPVLNNISTLYTCRDDGAQPDIHPINDAAIAWNKGMVEWVGKASDIPATFKSAEVIDAGGNIVIPGLVDCHTHLCFGGWRADEFEMRIQGRSYLEIAKAGAEFYLPLKLRELPQRMNFMKKRRISLKKLFRPGLHQLSVKVDMAYQLRMN